MEEFVPFQFTKDFQASLESLIATAIKEVTDDYKSNLSDSYLTKAEASKYLHISQVTLNKWISSTKLSPTIIGGICRFKKSDLDDFMLNNRK